MAQRHKHRQKDSLNELPQKQIFSFITPGMLASDEAAVTRILIKIKDQEADQDHKQMLLKLQ